MTSCNCQVVMMVSRRINYIAPSNNYGGSRKVSHFLAMLQKSYPS